MAHTSIRYLASGSLGNIVRGRVAAVRADISRRLAEVWGNYVDGSSISPRAKQRYKKAITPYSAGKGNAGAYINERIAKLLESGWKAFDMKPGLLAGLTKRVIPLQLEGSTVFRTVSTNSKSSSWRHPGYKGARVVSKVRQSVSRVVKEAIKNG